MEANIDFSEIREKVNSAITQLLIKDQVLFEINVNERTIMHKFALYLEEQLPGWDVDCEYNRKGEAEKVLDLPKDKIDWNDTEAKTIFPDIIVHKRMETNNLLVIELKKSNNNDMHMDFLKLEAFTSENGGFDYQYGLSIRFWVGVNHKRRPIMKWFTKGENIEVDEHE